MTFFCEVVACHRDLSYVRIRYDPVSLHSEAGPSKLLITNHGLAKIYHFHALIFRKKALISRGTRLFRAYSAGPDKHHESQKANMIIKGFWALAISHDGEVDLLKAALSTSISIYSQVWDAIPSKFPLLFPNLSLYTCVNIPLSTLLRRGLLKAASS